VISHQHKCIFIHIPKTAGTSINSYFHPGVKFHFKNPDYERLFGWCPKRRLHMQHATAKQLLETELITKSQWQDYYKFTFVRNPWDRAYSDYLFIQEFAGVKGSFKNYLNKEKEFKQILSDNSNYHFLGDHLLPQTDFFDEESYKLDFIGRFENFEEDIHFILNKLSINKKFNEYQNRSKRVKNYANFYKNSEVKLVSEIYTDDILKLNYAFNDNRTGYNKLKKFI